MKELDVDSAEDCLDYVRVDAVEGRGLKHVGVADRFESWPIFGTGEQ